MGQAGVRLTTATIVLALLPLGLAVASPAALDSQIVAIPPSADVTTASIGTRGGYATFVAVVDVAGTLTFTNADITAHDVVAHDLGPEDNPWCQRYVGHHFCPLFASRLVGLGGSAVVEGTDQLTPGTTYEFFCSVHHWMTGTLVAV